MLLSTGVEFIKAYVEPNSYEKRVQFNQKGRLRDANVIRANDENPVSVISNPASETQHRRHDSYWWSSGCR